MERKISVLLAAITIVMVGGMYLFGEGAHQTDDKNIINYVADVKKQDVKFYWKDDENENFGSIKNLEHWLEHKNSHLIFAMNGGMYKQDGSPQGLFIENQKTQTSLDTTNGTGNFYLKPNGVFYITIKNVPVICPTTEFKDNRTIKYATQSGPMLVVDGQINPAFKEGSVNVYVRNGVGILPDNKVVFAMSKTKISFYDFANYFKSIGCKNALYLDGFVSRMYLPEKNWQQTDGNFGVIIGITTPAN